MGALLIAGIATIVAGLGAITFGISIKEFGFGATLITVGAIGACTGMIMIGLAVVVGELKNIARRLAPRAPAEPRSRPVLAAPSALPARSPPPAESGFLFSRDEPAFEQEPESVEAAAPLVSPMPPISPIPRQDERGRPALAPVAEPVPEAVPLPSPPPPPKSPRNPLFSSRRERERAQLRAAEPAPAEERAAPAPETFAPPSPFDNAWPKPDRPPMRRGSRTPVAFKEAPAEYPAVTVVKSGVVDGMAYSLFSDGSIEAQMPEGMMRFGSIEELRTHLDQRT